MRRRMLASFLGSDNDAGFVKEAAGRIGVLELWESESEPGSHYVRFHYSPDDEGLSEDGSTLVTDKCFRTTRGTLEFDGMMVAIESNHRYEFVVVPKSALRPGGTGGAPSR